jgi:hypothetical protein
MAPEVKTAKNSKLPKMSENCFEPVGKGGWPPISIWIFCRASSSKPKKNRSKKIKKLKEKIAQQEVLERVIKSQI